MTTPLNGLRVDANRVSHILKDQLAVAHMQNAVLTVALEDAQAQIASLRDAIERADREHAEEKANYGKEGSADSGQEL